MKDANGGSLENTPTWIMSLICCIIVLISLAAARGLHYLGKYLKNKPEEGELTEALQKLKEELMLLGFISLVLTVSQNAISKRCVPRKVVDNMLPCGNPLKPPKENSQFKRCHDKGKVPFVYLEPLHQLHIFIFILAVSHVIFCATTMVLGRARMRQWKHWEDSIISRTGEGTVEHMDACHCHKSAGCWRRAAIISWLRPFFNQFYGSVTKSEYTALRHIFIMDNRLGNNSFDFHNYMLKPLNKDFKKIVRIRWYLWLFVMFFLLANVHGWNTYFWLSFLPLFLVLMVGAKLDSIIGRLARELREKRNPGQEGEKVSSDELFWFGKPHIVRKLIHFVLFQISFDYAFFFWILFTYGGGSCIMGDLKKRITRLVIGIMIQVLCSFSTYPLYVFATQLTKMDSELKAERISKKTMTPSAMVEEQARNRDVSAVKGAGSQTQRMENQPSTILDQAIPHVSFEIEEAQPVNDS